ncbi:MAG: ABC transporter substrate-binding protein [Saccharofermentans sp.]|nr:ABC transporter substrate-binding protein [Saccharofermentans sp.]
MKRFICILTVLALLTGLASCGQGSVSNASLNKVRTVSGNDEWWNDTETVITPEDIKQEFNVDFYELLGNFLAADENSVILAFNILSKESTDAVLKHYSYDGKLLGQVRLSDYFGEGVQFYQPETIFKLNGKYFTVIQHSVKGSDSFVNEGYEIDFDNSTLKDPFTLKLPDDGSMFSEVITMTGVGDKLVYLMSMGDFYNHSYKICVAEGGKTRSFAPDFGAGAELKHIASFMKYGEGVAFTAETIENGVEKKCFCTLDIDTFTMHKAELKTETHRSSYIPDCGVFDCDKHEVIRKVDIETGETKQLADLTHSFITGQYEDLRIVWATEDRIVLYADEQGPLGGMSVSHLITLDKADTNPNSGKEILSLAYTDWISKFEYGAVNAFNRSSDKYLIEVTSKYYDAATGVFDNDAYLSDYTLIEASEASAVDILKADIRKGEGPDLVLYGSDTAQLNNPDYLTDLTKRIKAEKSLTNGDYVKLVTSPNGRDGNHYRLDYGYNYTALMLKSDFISDRQAGLTFDQYDKLISERNGGNSILHEDSRALMKMFMENSDSITYTKDGNVSLGNVGFKAAASYVASIPDVMPYDDMSWVKMKNMQVLEGVTFNSFVYLYANAYKHYSIIGVPSSDGHAEVIKGRGVGITSCCALQDGAWEFALTFMSPDYQNKVNVYYDPVLKSAQKATFEEYINIWNAHINPYDNTTFPVEKGIVDYYIKQTSDAVTVPDMDSGIIVIMNEEMPAYFTGQKSLDEVMKIIENRVNLMLSEQG